jgi:hypothetical protein
MMNADQKAGDRAAAIGSYRYRRGIEIGTQLSRKSRIPGALMEFIIGSGLIANKSSDLGIETYFHDDTEAAKSDWDAVGKDLASSLYHSLLHMSRENRKILVSALINELAHQVAESQDAQLDLPFGNANGKYETSYAVGNQSIPVFRAK